MLYQYLWLFRTLLRFQPVSPRGLAFRPWSLACCGPGLPGRFRHEARRAGIG